MSIIWKHIDFTVTRPYKAACARVYPRDTDTRDIYDTPPPNTVRSTLVILLGSPSVILGLFYVAAATVIVACPRVHAALQLATFLLHPLMVSGYRCTIQMFKTLPQIYSISSNLIFTMFLVLNL